ncbi:SMI1/KNR4 family protein [uncultured Gimesia sp.]|uniref:SMI1/KNR4 family protein n=1 Tax=uncultured Gimesia sp. TaxID=1678688 RepID=UPI0030D7584D|tara:strand:- start:10054 stop:10575 length:522 start_codon:yes stop_codon:yes gene_type:complete
MSNLKDVITQIADLTIEDEDGEECEIELEDPASAEELIAISETIPLNAELIDFYSTTNGMLLFSEEIYDLEVLNFDRESGVITIHNWGNGDFTCIATPKSEFPEGTVLFMNHSPDVLVPIAASLSEWILKVVAEYQEKGALMHPGDYFQSPDEPGLYSHVIESLRGRDCELNG